MNIRLSNVLTNDVDIIVQPLGIDDYTPIDENLGFSLVVSGVTYQLKYIQDVDIRYLLFDNASPSQIEIYSIEFSTTPFTSNAVVVPLNLPSASFFPNAWNSTTPSFSNNAYTIPDTSFDFTNPQGWVLNYRPQFVRFIFDRTLASSPIKVFIADAQGRFILYGDTMLTNNELVSGDMLNLSWLWYDVGGTQMLKGDIYSIHFQFANVNQVITLRDIEWFVGP